MNILFIVQLVPERLIKSCTGLSVAGDMMIKNIITHLAQMNDVSIDIVSALPNDSYPRGKLFISKEMDEYNGTEVCNIGYVNLPIIKNIIQELSIVRKGIKSAKRKKYDIIICFNMYQQFGNSAILLHRILGIPLVSILADFPVEDKNAYSGYRRLLFDHVKKTTFKNILQLRHAILLNENANQYLDRRCDYILLPGGVNLEENVSGKPSGMRKNIIYAGALTEYSGIKNLIRAVQMIREFECELEIYGSGPLEEFVSNCGAVDSRIKYMGKKSLNEMRSIMRGAWILANPRSVDDPISKVTFPSKLFEYIMCERPVVSTVFEGMPLEIENCIFSCKSGNPEEIKKTISSMYWMDSEVLAKRVRVSVDYIKENMNWHVQCNKIYAYLKNIIDNMA